jgi:hypothetical protein
MLIMAPTIVESSGSAVIWWTKDWSIFKTSMGKLAKIAQAGIAGAEVIHCKVHSHHFDLLKYGDHGFGWASQGLFRFCNKRDPPAPRVLETVLNLRLTGFADEFPELRDLIKIGATILEKPFLPSELIRRVEDMLNPGKAATGTEG